MNINQGSFQAPAVQPDVVCPLERSCFVVFLSGYVFLARPSGTFPLLRDEPTSATTTTTAPASDVSPFVQKLRERESGESKRESDRYLSVGGVESWSNSGRTFSRQPGSPSSIYETTNCRNRKLPESGSCFLRRQPNAAGQIGPSDRGQRSVTHVSQDELDELEACVWD